MIAQAAGGPISVTGWPDQPPVKPGLSFGDTGTGMLMAATVLGALHERNRTGQGRLLEIAMQEAMIHYMRTCFATMMRTGKPAPAPRRQAVGRQQRPGRPLPLQGRRPQRLSLHHDQPRQSRALCAADETGRPRGSDRGPAFRHRRRARAEHAEELDRIIGEWTGQHDKREVMEKLIAVGVPAGAVFDTLELQNEPYFEEQRLHAAGPSP